MSKRIPKDAAAPCRCGGTLEPVPGTEFYDADGSAMVDLRCNAPRCRIESFHSWNWK